LFSTLEAAAHAADAEETAFRREAAARIETLERARTFAFRRLNVLRAMAEAARRAPDPEASIAAQIGVIRERLGWGSAEEGTPRAVLERLSALAACIDAEVRANAPSDDPCAELARFEDWYTERFGGPFWALFDRYSPRDAGGRFLRPWRCRPTSIAGSPSSSARPVRSLP
jgi:hypothetical protein